MYREFVKPYHQEIVDYFREKKISHILHICGYIDPIMEDIASIGVDAVSIDDPSSLRKMVEVSEKRVVVIGNVATALSAEGSKEQIEAAVKDCIEAAVGGSYYILSPGCQLPANTRTENIQYFLEAAHKYGRYNSKAL